MRRIVFGTLRRRWLRTLLTGLSTLIAFMLLGFFLAIRHGFAVGVVQTGADLVLLESANRATGLPIGMLSTVSAFPGVRAAMGMMGTQMLFGAHRRHVVVQGLSSNAFLEVSGLVGSGAVPREQAQAWLMDRTGALVSETAAHEYGWRIGQTVTLHAMRGGPSHDLTFDVAGVIVSAKSKGVTLSSDVNLHLSYFRSWAHTDLLGVMFIQVKQAGQADAVARAIELRFANSPSPVNTQSFKSLLQGMAERLADVNALTFVVIAASLFGLFLICFNALIHSASERLGEFALLKAIGFAPVRLVWLVLLEASLAILPAAAAGVLCALLVIRVFVRARMDLPGIMLTPTAMVECALTALGLMILCSLLPGLRIARVNCGYVLRKG